MTLSQEGLPLLKYDRYRLCPKCGEGRASAEYCLAFDHTLDGRLFVVAPGEDQMPPHLDRVCGNCGYIWFELTLDAPSLMPQEPEGYDHAPEYVVCVRYGWEDVAIYNPTSGKWVEFEKKGR